MKKDSAIKVGVLASSNFITVLVNTVLFPIFPAMARALNLSLGDLALLVGIVNFPAAAINILGGVLADLKSRKLVIVISLFLYGLGGLIAGAAVLLLEDKSYPFILVGRFLQGMGSAPPMFLTLALVGDMFSSMERTKALGFLEAANSLGKIASPILGGAVGLLVWYAIFFVYPLLAFPIAIITWFFIKDPPNQRTVDWQKQKQSFTLLKNTSRLLALLAAFWAIFTLIGTMFWLSDFLESRLHINTLLRGLIISIPAFAMMVSSLLAGKIGSRINPRWILSTGLLLMSGGLFLTAFTAKTIFFWPVIFLVGAGAGFSLPVIDTVSTSVKSKDGRGEMTTIFGSSRTLGGAFAPMTFSFLLHYGLKATFITISSLTLVTALLAFLLFKEKEVLPQELLPTGNNSP